MTTPEPSPLEPLTEDEFRLVESLMLAGLRVRQHLALRLIAQARAARPSPWQPIEEADDVKQTREIVQLYDGEYVTVGNWAGDGKGGGYWAVTEAGDFAGPGWEPTHFAKLLAAPSPPAQDGGLT